MSSEPTTPERYEVPPPIEGSPEIRTAALDYKVHRLENQITWYEKKASINKRNFRSCQIIILVAGAIIPIVNIVGYIFSGRFEVLSLTISSSLSAIIVIIAGITYLEKYQEIWILYRTTAALLKREKYLYENQAGEYSDLDDSLRNKLLVERVEYILSDETMRYSTMPQHQSQYK